MNIIKALHPSLLHITFQFESRSYFAASLLWGFRLDSGEAVLEQELWTVISEVIGKNEMFDAAMPKAKGEVLLHGSFFAPGEKKVRHGNVSLRMDSVYKVLFVYGDRQWRKTLGFAPRMEGPEFFSEMPVSYSNAFGGEGYDKNPMGKGFIVLETESGKIHPLPNIEYPNHLIVYPGDCPEPASFSRLDMMWKQRFSKAGTYNKKYIKERMPGLPDDIDWTYFNDAAPDQWIEGYFRGDEAFEISNMNPDTAIQQGTLPGVYGRCFVNHEIEGEIHFKEIETKLDTVWFFPKENIGILIHRGYMEVNEDDGTDIRQIIIAHENLDDPPRSIEHYQDELRKRTDPEELFKYIMYTAPLIPKGCRCGFEVMKEQGNSSPGQLGQENMLAFSKQKEKEGYEHLDQQKADIEKKMESLNHEEIDVDINSIFEKIKNADGQQESPETKKIKELMENIAPGITDKSDKPGNFDFTQLNLKGFDDLKKYTEELAAKKQKEAEEKLSGELLRLKEMGDLPEAKKAVVKLEKTIAEMKLPPKLPRFPIEESMQSARQQIAEAQKQLMLMRSMGISEDQLAQASGLDIDIDRIENQVKQSLENAQDGYRIGAHYMEEARSPHEGREAEIATALQKNYEEGGHTAGGDYAFTDISGLDLSGIDLSGAYLEYANLTNTNLNGANLSNAILAHANLSNTDFSNTNLSGANLGASLIDNAQFVDADLSAAILGKAIIRNAKFHRCKLTDRMEMFLETQFENADFTGSDLKKNNFIDADISGCCFAEADLTESNFINPQMTDTVFDKALLQSVNFVKAEGKNTSFIQASMKNVRFVGGCNLGNSDFSGARADDANFRDCQLNNADFSETFLFKTDFGGSDLTSAKFVKANAVQAQFNKANLVYADLYRIHLMEGSLYKARLSGARFTEANLYSVNFMGCIVGEEDMDDADFTDAYM